MQLIGFISFILILVSVPSNNHTHMVFAEVMPTSFADKLCLHISTPAANMALAVLMFLGSKESLYHYVTNGVTRLCAILSKKLFLFIFFSG